MVQNHVSDDIMDFNVILNTLTTDLCGTAPPERFDPACEIIKSACVKADTDHASDENSQSEETKYNGTVLECLAES